jgi:hypothetical protein
VLFRSSDALVRFARKGQAEFGDIDHVHGARFFGQDGFHPIAADLSPKTGDHRRSVKHVVNFHLESVVEKGLTAARGWGESGRVVWFRSIDFFTVLRPIAMEVEKKS